MFNLIVKDPEQSPPERAARIETRYSQPVKPALSLVLELAALFSAFLNST
jgi:hypothetical protein